MLAPPAPLRWPPRPTPSARMLGSCTPPPPAAAARPCGPRQRLQQARGVRQQLLAQGLAAGAEAAAVGCGLAAAERVILRGATHDLPWPARRLWGIGKAFPRLQAGGVSKSACLQSLLQLSRTLWAADAGFGAGSWLSRTPIGVLAGRRGTLRRDCCAHVYSLYSLQARGRHGKRAAV